MTGKEHEKIAITLWAPATVASWAAYANGYQDIAVGIALGAFSGFLITPDIDINATTREEYRLYKIFWPLGLIWQNLWAPYGLLFAHRGWSHTPVVGTLTRVTYALIIALLSMVTFNEWIRLAQYDKRLMVDPTILFVFFWYNMTFCLSWFAMWCIQDIMHFICDIISTAIKKEGRRAIRNGDDW